jgi:hypothetical protein
MCSLKKLAVICSAELELLIKYYSNAYAYAQLQYFSVKQDFLLTSKNKIPIKVVYEMSPFCAW